MSDTRVATRPYIIGSTATHFVVPAGGTKFVVGDAGWTGPTTGLTAGWPLNDAHVSGLTIEDTIGTDDLTSTASGIGSGDFNPGINYVGFARTIDNSLSTTVMQGASTTTIISNQVWSAACWVNFTDVTVTGTGGNRATFLSIQGGAAFVRFCNNISAGAGFLGVGWLDDSSTAQSATVTSQAAFNNTWVHICFVYSSGTTGTLYINGLPVATSTANPCTAPGGNSNFALGNFGLTGATMGGALAEVVVYAGKALSAGEVTTLYAAQ